MTDDLGIEILTEGDGLTTSIGSRISVHYKGMLTNGVTFDASRPRGMPFSFEIGAGQVIQGWEQGVIGMKVSEVRKLTIPPKLAYGATGAGNLIPPNATLIFEIELLEISDPINLGEACPEILKKAQKEGAVIIDVRREDEWKDTGVISDALTITAFQQSGTIDPKFQEKFLDVVPSTETPLVLYCGIGVRSANIGNALINQLGYTNVSHLTTGIRGWLAEGHEVVEYKE